MEKKEIVITDKKKKLNLRSEKENRVFILKLTNCIKVQKINKREILYTNM